MTELKLATTLQMPQMNHNSRISVNQPVTQVQITQTSHLKQEINQQPHQDEPNWMNNHRTARRWGYFAQQRGYELQV